ncbi:GNAT family N-acetyltransferase [Bacillus sp. V2I10]|uniref:GNAT family N-acetyltransferase n=1 Tax=Bacillus sp. V2I10 TaxID=3042276 RepID=UPI0027829BB5|nr:GNAT family N-acetyltransferase [Bacillus sp. V2I10]MDQ0861091.1 GNAT superfamily N-acetyltransferase [Bacillus sp. V2I10]
MNNQLTLERLNNEDFIVELESEFEKQGKRRTKGYFEKCYLENISGNRVTILAYYKGKLAGCCHLIKSSGYPYFNENNIPEINDLNVFPEYRNKGIAGSIIDELEKIISKTHNTVGIGVGLYKDYGSAQRLYCKKGYIPDGNGIQYNYEKVLPGTHVFVDDDLNLYFTKKLK